MSSDRPLVSVILPAYNAAPTVADAVNSVISQQMTDWELIVVNDGSADATAGQALQAMRHAKGIDGSRLRLIGHDINRGSAAAWQTGLEASRGEFVTKLDADDTLTPQALRLLCDAANATGAKVVRGQYNRVTRNSIRRFGPLPERVSLNDHPISVDYFSLCGKLIDRTLLTAPGMAAFPRLDRWEDLGVVARVMALRPSVTTIAQPVYNYNIAPRGKSLSTSARERLLSDHIAVARALDDWLASRNLTSDYSDFLSHLKFAAKVKYLRGRNRDVAAWKRTFPEVNGRVMHLRHVPLCYRLLFATVAVLPTRLSQSVSDLL